MAKLKYFAVFSIIMLLNEVALPQVPASIPIHATLTFTSSNLPIVIIDTFGQSIKDEYRIQAYMKIICNVDGKRNYLTDAPNNYDGWIDIELRGSASLTYPKKQYRFETQDASRNNLNVSLMGMPAENDWILYGPYDDQSLIRNALAYKLSNEIGRYASRTRFCELVLNNDYRGLYVLMEKIKRDKNRVAISSLDSLDVSGDAVTGGYIIKFDKEKGENVGGWRSSRGIFYQYHYPKADEIISAQKNYIRDFMNQFELAMTRQNISDLSVGYPKYIDVESFVDHFILCEYCKNIDAYRISNYMFKDRDSKGGKLHEGPIWDFNLAFGKTWFPEDAYRVDEWEIDHNQYKPNDWPKVPFWWERLGHDPEFARHVMTRWNQLSKGTLHQDNVYQMIDSLIDTLQEARIRNFERWPESAKNHSYETEIQKLKQWINGRIAWIEANLNKLAAVEPGTETGNIPQAFLLSQNYPNPFNGETVIRYFLSRSASIKLAIYNLFGNEIRVLLHRHQDCGNYEARWDGKDGAGQPVAGGVYIYELIANEQHLVKKLLLLH